MPLRRPPEILDICAEVVLVRRAGSHALPLTGRPEVVEEFASATFRAALQQTVRKWHPAIAQLEFTQLAQYAPDCAPARTILVEHDVTFDLYQQLLRLDDRWELRREAGSLAQVRNRRLANRGPRRHHEREGPPHRDQHTRRRPPQRRGSRSLPSHGDSLRTRAASSSSAASPIART